MAALTLGQRLRAARVAMGYSGERFADRLGVDRSRWSRIERDEAPVGRDVVEALAGLGVDVEALVYGSGERIERALRETIEGTYRLRTSRPSRD